MKRIEPEHFAALLPTVREVRVALVLPAQQGQPAPDWRRDDGDVLVRVELVPDLTRTWCRLAACAGSLGDGVWGLPDAGSEVVVLIPDGNAEQADPILVATLSSGRPPVELDRETPLCLTSAGNLAIRAGEGKKLLLNGGGRGVARRDDTTSEGTLVLSVQGAGVALQATYTPGDGSAVQTVGPSPSITLVLKGKVTSASDAVEADP